MKILVEIPGVRLLLSAWLLSAVAPPLHAETAAQKKKRLKAEAAAGPPQRPLSRHKPATKIVHAPQAHHPGHDHRRGRGGCRAPVDLGPVDPNRPPNVYARSVMLIDARTGETLYEKDADARRPIASTTKLLTALIVAESGNLSAQDRGPAYRHDLRADQALLQARRAATPATRSSTRCSSTVAMTWLAPSPGTTPAPSPISPTR